ncbi:unnamed protein product (macronuclear) [Paramecium tetraurelia]|uniref:Uncharacterized protein n=1 Tax=Paramecium tetraurelia TaxID=5888 RepID=A0CH18_PARTE|nr:uncharacterized protein GSPATT00007525001 [Paramecium tetraurelia]CAK70085.1 unnamed protein product [Paramecium tetraurelia]|eukprot:XP_001437482.1 hypothetical protein (macronuclear) [Paramecium tetraurelia strain d4-2]
MNTPDWLKEKLNWKSKSKNKRIPLKMLNHGSNSTPWNQKTVKRDLLDNKHGMQSNQKSMKTQTAERAAQNEIVDRLQEHISEKLSTTAQFISKRN